VTLSRAITARGAARLYPSFVVALLMLATVLCPIGARAHDEMTGSHGHADNGDRGVVFGLTGKELAIAAAIGAGLGGTAAMVVNGATVGAGAGAGVGMLALIYFGHIAAEALVVGGLWYLWPEIDPPEEPPGTIGPISTVSRISGLGLAVSTRQASQ
jgi:hypothetical protein